MIFGLYLSSLVAFLTLQRTKVLLFVEMDDMLQQENAIKSRLFAIILNSAAL